MISKLLEADAKSVEETSDVDSFDDTSDEDYETGRPRRSTRLCMSYAMSDIDWSSSVPDDDMQVSF